MDFYVNLLLGLGWLLFIVYFLRLWRKEYLHLRQVRREAQAPIEQHVSEPEPVVAKKPNYSAVALMDQVDALISRLDEAELNADIDEIHMRGW